MLKKMLCRAAVLWAVLCLALPSAVAAEPLVLAVSRTPFALPLFVADKQGFFASEGLPLKIVEVVGGHRSLQQVLDGLADFATCSDAVVMFNSFKRDDFAILATFSSSAEDVKLVAHPTSGITSAEHLAGKKVGTIVGAASHYYLTSLAVINGVDPKSIRVVPVQPENMAKVLKEREVDAIASWQPYARQTEEAIPGSKVIPDSGFYMETFNLVIARKLIGSRDGDLEKMLRAVARAEEFIAGNPKQAQEILRTKLGMDQAYIDWHWPRYRYRLTLDQALLKTLESEARWARTEGLVLESKSPNYLNFIYAKPLRRILPVASSLGE